MNCLGEGDKKHNLSFKHRSSFSNDDYSSEDKSFDQELVKQQSIASQLKDLSKVYKQRKLKILVANDNTF